MKEYSKISLRAVELSDIDKLYEWENDTEQWNIGSNNRYISRFDLENYVLSCQNEDIFKTEQTRNIIYLDSGKEKTSIGCVDLFDIDSKHQRAAIGFYIDKKHRGKRYAKQTLVLLEEYAKNTLLLHQLYALIGEENKACQNVFYKSDYNKVAVLPHWIRRKDGFEDVFVFQKIL